MYEQETKLLLMTEFQKFNYVPHTYPNPIGLWPNEQESLMWTALNSDPTTNWMEIGSFCGGSATIMCIARRFFSAKPTVYSVDRNFCDFGEVFDRNLYIFGQFNDIHKKIETDSVYLKDKYDGSPLGFVFIDGWHSFKGCLVDFENIESSLIPGGFVAFHDTWQQPYRKDDMDIYLNIANNNYALWMNEQLPAEPTAKQTYNLDCVVAWIVDKYKYKIVDNPMLDGTNNCFVTLRKPN